MGIFRDLPYIYFVCVWRGDIVLKHEGHWPWVDRGAAHRPSLIGLLVAAKAKNIMEI